MVDPLLQEAFLHEIFSVYEMANEPAFETRDFHSFGGEAVAMSAGNPVAQAQPQNKLLLRLITPGLDAKAFHGGLPPSVSACSDKSGRRTPAHAESIDPVVPAHVSGPACQIADASARKV
jgi:hypothetical protein